jgi:hypothetical protein
MTRKGGPNVTAGDFDPSIHRALTRLAARALQLVDRVGSAMMEELGPDAPAFADQGLPVGSTDLPLGRFPLTLAGAALSVAADHVRTFVRVMEVGPFPIYALMTLLRTPLEAAALSRWLLEPGASPTARVSRGIAAQLEDYRQRRAFELAIGRSSPPASGALAADRYAELVIARDAAKLPGLAVPRWAAVISEFGPVDDGRDASWSYRMASAFAHGFAWAALAANLGEGTPIAPGIQKGLISANEGSVLIVAERAVRAVELAVSDFEWYIGARPAN